MLRRVLDSVLDVCSLVLMALSVVAMLGDRWETATWTALVAIYFKITAEAGG